MPSAERVQHHDMRRLYPVVHQRRGMARGTEDRAFPFPQPLDVLIQGRPAIDDDAWWVVRALWLVVDIPRTAFVQGLPDGSPVLRRVPLFVDLLFLLRCVVVLGAVCTDRGFRHHYLRVAH